MSNVLFRRNGVQAECTTLLFWQNRGSKWRRLPESMWPLLTVYDMCKAVDKEMVIEKSTINQKKPKAPFPFPPMGESFG